MCFFFFIFDTTGKAINLHPLNQDVVFGTTFRTFLSNGDVCVVSNILQTRKVVDVPTIRLT
jgi:hypothetical protein